MRVFPHPFLLAVITKLPREYLDESGKLSTDQNIELRSRFDLVLVGKAPPKAREDDLGWDMNHLPYVGNRTSTFRAESDQSTFSVAPVSSQHHPHWPTANALRHVV